MEEITFDPVDTEKLLKTVLKKCFKELKKNKDIEITTKESLVINYLVKKIEECGWSDIRNKLIELLDKTKK